MLKNYFMSFEVIGEDFSKYIWGFYQIDLKEEQVIDVCRDIVSDRLGEQFLEGSTIKIIAFNNIK